MVSMDTLNFTTRLLLHCFHRIALLEDMILLTKEKQIPYDGKVEVYTMNKYR